MTLLKTAQGRFLRQPRHVIAALRLLVLASLAMLGVGTKPLHPIMFWSVAIVYAVTVIAYLWTNDRWFQRKRFKAFVFLFDIVAVSMLIILRGDEVPSFLAAYFALVLMAAIVEGLGNAVFNAVFVSCLFTVITRWGVSPEQLLTFANLGQFVFFFIIALFMGHIAEGARDETHGRQRAEQDSQRAQAALRTTSAELRQSTAELKAARESLRANDRLFTLGMLSAGIAHEMKNPIAAILASVREAPDMLQELEDAIRKNEDPSELLEEVRDVVVDCDTATNQLQKVAMDLNDMVRGGRSEVRSIAPGESIDGAARMIRKAAGETVEIIVDCTAERLVRADPGRLMQVLLNLAKNAIDAMRGNGGGTLRMGCRDTDDCVTFIVADDGPGIPADVRDRMFDPFFTTKGPGKGTGLGLHLVSEIVKSQSGTMRCETELGKGTQFYVDLPGAVNTPIEEVNDGRQADNAVDRRRRGDDSQGAQENIAA